jgi:Domain of unknown function (DUF4258)
MTEPFHPFNAKCLIRQILDMGEVSFSQHALTEMTADELTTVDCVNVLRGGVVEEPEWERGSWRYRVRTARIYVVVVFRSSSALTVVTAWRTSA